MEHNYRERADVLALKLKGLPPNKIAESLNITVSKVMSHDKAIKKAMAKGDAEELASMSPEELEFAKEAVGQMLPYMRKSLDTIQESTKTLQTIHTTALDVAEKIFKLIDKKLDEDGVSIKEVKELAKLFEDTYAVLYNKNGIQIVNLLASNPTSTEALDKKETMRAELEAMRDRDIADADVIEADIGIPSVQT